mgnify:CR=1 FL=1
MSACPLWFSNPREEQNMISITSMPNAGATGGLANIMFRRHEASNCDENLKSIKQRKEKSG